MNIWKSILASLVLTWGLGTNEAFSQTYPQTENGSVIYYKILSAYPDYEARNLCLYDNTTGHASYDYVLRELDPESRQQEWSLITAKAENDTYHLRSRSSYHYMSVSGKWENNHYLQIFSTRKNDSDALKITSLGDDQVSISFQDGNDKRYLGAVDVDADPVKFSSKLKNSPWAWKIYKAEDLANGILESFVPEPIIIVSDRTIHVVGASNWETFDVAGRLIPSDQTLMPGGVYVVRIGNVTKKVVVK